MSSRTEPSDDVEVPEEQPHLHDYLAILARRRTAFLVAFLAVFFLGTLRTLLTRPVYSGTAQVLIDREAPNVLSFKQVAEVDTARDDYYQTQYKLLQSRALARRTIEALDLLQDAEFGGPRAADEVAKAYKSNPGDSHDLEAAITGLLGRLTVQAQKNTRLVNVSFEASRPELAASVANRLAQLYITQNVEYQYQSSAEAAQWLGLQAEDQRKKVRATEAALEALKQKEGIVNIDERRTLLEQKLKDLGANLTTISTARIQKEALYRQMLAAPAPEELPDVRNNPLVQSLSTQQADLERRLAEALEKYMDRHPEVVKLRTQIDEIKLRIRREAQAVIRAAENDYKSAAAQEASVAAALDATKREIQALSERATSYDALRKDLDASNEVLKSLVSREKQTDVAQELRATNLRIVDPAVASSNPVRPRRVRDIAISLILGLGAGLALALFLEYLDNTVKLPDDVRQYLGAPLLAVIPEAEQPSEVDGNALITATAMNGGLALTDGFRVLRTALGFSWPEQKSRIVMLTSTAPAEGKTLCSINLALALSSVAEDRVLLIDADLRKPSDHTVLRVRRSPGLSDILVGRAAPSASIVTPQGTHLDFIPAGSPVPSPADLLTSQSIPALLEGLRRIYRWIVIDSPPLAAVPDALILSPHVDGVLVVIGAEMVPRRAVKQTLERIEDGGARVLGCVLNRVHLQRHSYYYGYHYGHYYGTYHQPTEAPAPSKVANIQEKKRSSSRG